MFGSKPPFLFPHESVPHLRDTRDAAWAELVDRIAELDETDEDSLAFQLMMIRVCGCLRCTNYKANLGCTVCSQRAVRNTKAPTSTMMRWFAKAREEIGGFLTKLVAAAEQTNDGKDEERKAA